MSQDHVERDLSALYSSMLSFLPMKLLVRQKKQNRNLQVWLIFSRTGQPTGTKCGKVELASQDELLFMTRGSLCVLSSDMGPQPRFFKLTVKGSTFHSHFKFTRYIR